jgi:hypothetical protein
MERHAFVVQYAFEHSEVPSSHLGKAFDGTVIEMEGKFGKLHHLMIARARHDRSDAAVEDGTEAHLTRLAVEYALRLGRQEGPIEHLAERGRAAYCSGARYCF